MTVAINLHDASSYCRPDNFFFLFTLNGQVELDVHHS